MDSMIKKYLTNGKADYLSNTLVRTFPDGLDIEIFSKKTLKIAFKNDWIAIDCKRNAGI